VVVVNSAYQAMALLPGCAVGVVLCDVQMPGMSGIELLVALGNHPGLPPFILWTGGPSAECEQSALAAGARAFLAKPAESQRLFQLVDDLVGADAPR
jgi:CheY-like chemotaxis protein